jgi:hypothetical protein
MHSVKCTCAVVGGHWQNAGASWTTYLRISYSDYSDGTSTPAGLKTNRHNPRDISNRVVFTSSSQPVSKRDLSAMAYQWGQVSETLTEKFPQVRSMLPAHELGGNGVTVTLESWSSCVPQGTRPRPSPSTPPPLPHTHTHAHAHTPTNTLASTVPAYCLP